MLENIGALLEAGGLSFADVVRTTVFLADMNDFAAMNEVYAAYFTEPYPARATVQVARLPRDARIEIDVDRELRLEAADQRVGLTCPSRPPPACPLDVQHAVDAAQRLDHLLEVLEVADLDRHVDPRALVVVGVRFHVLDVGVDVGDLAR